MVSESQLDLGTCCIVAFWRDRIQKPIHLSPVDKKPNKTIASKLPTTPQNSIDLGSYQEFWSNLTEKEWLPYLGQSVAVQFFEQGWRIIEHAGSLEELHAKLVGAGVDLQNVVFDHVPIEDENAVGLQIQ